MPEFQWKLIYRANMMWRVHLWPQNITAKTMVQNYITRHCPSICSQLGFRTFGVLLIFFIAAVLKIYQTNKEYLSCTFFIKMYIECNEHHLNYYIYWVYYTWSDMILYLYFKDKKYILNVNCSVIFIKWYSSRWYRIRWYSSICYKTCQVIARTRC